MMKRNFKLLMTMLVIAAMAFTVVGCGKKKTLESEWDSQRGPIDASIQQMKEQYAETGVLDDIKVYAKENTMVMEFTYSDMITADMFDDSTINQMGSMFSSAFKSQISVLEDEIGVDGIKINVIIYLSTGEELFNETY